MNALRLGVGAPKQISDKTACHTPYEHGSSWELKTDRWSNFWLESPLFFTIPLSLCRRVALAGVAADGAAAYPQS